VIPSNKTKGNAKVHSRSDQRSVSGSRFNGWAPLSCDSRCSEILGA
jgi:hypothetical protein